MNFGNHNDDESAIPILNTRDSSFPIISSYPWAARDSNDVIRWSCQKLQAICKILVTAAYTGAK